MRVDLGENIGSGGSGGQDVGLSFDKTSLNSSLSSSTEVPDDDSSTLTTWSVVSEYVVEDKKSGVIKEWVYMLSLCWTYKKIVRKMSAK
jgi:hypothetical protein